MLEGHDYRWLGSHLPEELEPVCTSGSGSREWGGGGTVVASGEAEASESLVRKHQVGCVQFIEKQCPELT